MLSNRITVPTTALNTQLIDAGAYIDGDKNVENAVQEYGAKFIYLSEREYIGNHISDGVAHRGYSSVAPENTLPAYELASTNGFKYVECDVEWTSDNVPVLLHDSTIDRTSDGTGSINALTLEQVKLYDYGSWKHSDYNGTEIPTFFEFILLSKNLGLHPYVELKGTITSAQAIIVKNIVLNLGMINNVSWISFSIGSLTEIKTVIPHARLGYLCALSSENITSALSLKNGINEVFLDVSSSGITQALLDSASSYDLPVEVWTINDSLTAYSLSKMGINGITTDSLIMSTVLAMKETTLAWFKMDETSGTSIADKSSVGATATAVGGITITDPLVSDGGKSRTGDGGTGMIDTSVNLSNVTNFKISFFIKRNAETTGWRSLLGSYKDTSDGSNGFYCSTSSTTDGKAVTRLITTISSAYMESTKVFTIGVTYKIILEYTGINYSMSIYSVASDGTLTLFDYILLPLTGSLKANLRNVRMLASTNTVPAEFAPYTVDEVKITHII